MIHQLNEQQRAIVDWVIHGRGSANIVARAGCGKTHTAVHGVVRAIVEHGRGEVALMAFSKSASDEFKVRLKLLAEGAEDDRFTNWKHVDAGTVHSFGFRAVRRWSPDVKLDENKLATICHELSGGNPHSVYAREAGPICHLVSLAKQAAFGFLEQPGDRSAWYDLAEHHAVNDLTDGGDLDEVVEAAVKVLCASLARDRWVVDFDDMILAPLAHELRIWPKDWVIVDEAQDTNPARRALALKLLKPRTGRFVAIGDDRQAIYGFTGADADSLDRIRRELNSVVLPLTITYRCPKAVVAEANRLVPDLVAHETAPDGAVRVVPYESRRLVKQCDGTEVEAVEHWFFDERPGAADAVLCRNTKPLVEQAYALLAAGIGCRVEGREIGEGLVKLATRWKRVTTLGQLTDKLTEYRDREVQKWQAKGREDRAQAAEDKVEALLAITAGLVREGKTLVTDLVAWVRDLFGDTRPGEVPNVLTLSTIHKAKGREWERVYLLFRSTTLPSRWARKDWQLLQEENLEYVAVTRAKRELVYVD